MQRVTYSVKCKLCFITKVAVVCAPINVNPMLGLKHMSYQVKSPFLVDLSLFHIMVTVFSPGFCLGGSQGPPA